MDSADVCQANEGGRAGDRRLASSGSDIGQCVSRYWAVVEDDGSRLPHGRDRAFIRERGKTTETRSPGFIGRIPI